MGFGRLLAPAMALLLGTLDSGASAAERPAAQDGAGGSAASAEIELHKTFRPAPRSRRQPSRAGNLPGAGEAATDAADFARPPARRLDAAATALGESLQSSGTLHLPGVGGRDLVLQESLTPVLEFGTGRRVIIDTQAAIAPDTAAEISRLWPGYAVVHPAGGADLRTLIGSLLDASGYETVLRSAPLTFGRGVTIRFTPDFVILRSVQDLLQGETRAISVVESADAMPAELRELAADQRVRLVELTPDGIPAGPDRAPWRDPSGFVTTMETGRLASLLGEIAAALGVATERRIPDPGATGNPAGHAADAALEAVGALLARSGITAIGPTVELYRVNPAGGRGRFVISIPGWLAEVGGRRLLITGASMPEMVRLFLTREGIDIFEYRFR